MRSFAAIGLAVTLASAAAASAIEFRLDPVDNSGAGFEPGTLTYDFRIRHSPGDYCTGFSLLATLTDATYRNNSGPFASDYAPDPQYFPFDPRLPFDCFLTGSDLYPNSNTYRAGEFAVPPGNVWGISADGRRFGNIWNGLDATIGFEVGFIPPNAGGDGALYTFARFTFLPESPNWTLNVRGDSISSQGGAPLYAFNVTVPEPGSAAGVVAILLALLARDGRRMAA